MKRLILGVAAALLLTAGQAAADGLPSRGHARASDPGPNWNGFYVGFGIGAGAAVSELSVDAPGINIFSFDGIGSSGVFGTVTVGYDRVIRPGWVAGVFADYDFGNNISSEISILNLVRIPLVEFQDSWSIGGRLGVLTNPGTLVYATGGFTQTDVDILGGLLSKTLDGYFVGGGFETFLRSNWSLKLEYRYTQYNDETLVSLGPIDVNLDNSTHAARAVLSYKFGGHND